MPADSHDPYHVEPPGRQSQPAGWFSEAPAARRTTPPQALSSGGRLGRRRPSGRSGRQIGRSVSRYALPALAIMVIAGLLAGPRLLSGSAPATEAPTGVSGPAALSSAAASGSPAAPAGLAVSVSADPTVAPTDAPAGDAGASPDPADLADLAIAAPPAAATTTPAPPAPSSRPSSATPQPKPAPRPKKQKRQKKHAPVPSGPVADDGSTPSRHSGPAPSGPVKDRVILSTSVQPAGRITPRANTTVPAFGYRIHRTSTAAGGWLGARRLDDDMAYRFHPRATAAEGRYRSAVTTSGDLGGAGHGPSVSQTAQAAYLLSQYGALRRATDRRTQAAAVDAAVTTLVGGRAWGYTHARGTARLAQSHHGATLRSWTKQLLTDARAHAGPLTMTLPQGSVTAGQDMALSVTVSNTRTHRVQRGLRVTFTYGTTTRSAVTDSHGVATIVVTVAPGAHQAQAVIDGLPAWLVVYRNPTDSRRSPVALAGRSIKLTARGTVTGLAPLAASITNNASTIAPLSPLAGHYTLTGGTGSATLTVRVWGPVRGPGGAQPVGSACGTGSPTYTATLPGVATGTHPLPAWKPTEVGYYAWEVAGTCGAPVRVRAASATTQTRYGKATTGLKKNFGLRARVSGFGNAGESHTLTARLFGPFTSSGAARCTDTAKQVRALHTTTTAHGTWLLKTSIGAAAGYYIWQTTFSEGNLVAGSHSTCGLIVHVTR